MTVVFTLIVLTDGWLDGAISPNPADNSAVQGTVLAGLIAVLIALAQIEFANLISLRKFNHFTLAATAGSILTATCWYWPQIIDVSPGRMLAYTLAGVTILFFLFQYFRHGTEGVVANCSAGLFSVIYLGIMSSFVLAVRIEFGVFELLMFVFVVKSSDIGAYTAGKLFGRHKFSPNISPAKSWEGLAGGIIFAAAIAFCFAAIFDIMQWWLAIIFAAVFTFLGQLSDLAESMIKRDAGLKDASARVPGFGGILDVVDSLLMAAPAAYLFFLAIRVL